MLCYVTCFVMLYNMCHVMLCYITLSCYITCHVMLYNIKYVIKHMLCYVI